MKPMVEQAIRLAKLGLAVFPLYTVETVDGHRRCSCGKTCGSPGKHPLTHTGFHEATTDTQLIREWWAGYPDANIGIATGDVSNLFVLDIDVKGGGDLTLDTLEARFDRLPETWTAWTGSGGAHFYFRMPRIDVRNSAGAIGPGIDVRGNGGYVVAPPSQHIAGVYAWNADGHPRNTDIAQAPHWLLERVTAKTSAAIQTEEIPKQIPEGMRNHWLASAAGTMRRRGFCNESMEAALLIVNRKRCTPPLSDREVRQIARSIERYKPERTLRFGRNAA